MLGTSGHERAEGDFYPTPPDVTRAVLPYLPKGVAIWEPAAGDGAMATVLRVEGGYRVAESDIAPRNDAPHVDFLAKGDLPPNTRWIVTNPPYSLAEEFVRKALDLTYPSGGVAMLLRNEWDCASSRIDLFGRPFARKIVLTWRPRWIAGSTGSPRHNYAWFVWSWSQGRIDPAQIVHATRPADPLEELL